MQLGKVDAVAEKDLARRFSVEDYPTLKIFRKGKDYKYLGPKEGWGKYPFEIKQKEWGIVTPQILSVGTLIASAIA